MNIFEFISDELRTHNAFLHVEEIVSLFSTYNTIVFFDGLDEIFDIQERLAVRNDIEKFSGIVEKAQIIITSRFESYKEVYFENNQYQRLNILDFDDYQIRDYIERWYSIEESNPGIRKKEIEGCFLELKNRPDELKRNPLLLSLIVILYRNQQELPPSKFDIYEGCTRTILETRDEGEKKLAIVLPISNKLATFSSLAYWQFLNEETKKVIIDHRSVKLFLKDYLIKKGELDEDSEAEQAVDRFIEFSKVRSIYFENKFTHKTFLEYFTAYYIYSSYSLKSKNQQKRDELINENMSKASWAEILELLICKIDKEQVDYEEIDGIADLFIVKNKTAALIFLLGILKYLRNISPTKIKDLILKSFDMIVASPMSSNNERAGLLSEILKLTTLERFKSNFIKISKSQIVHFNNDIEKSNYFLFYKEFELIGGKTQMLPAPIPIESNPELDYYLLENYSSLDNWKQYFELMIEFQSRFGKEVIFRDIQAYCGSKIFFQSDTFNFVSNALLSPSNIESLISNIKNLEKLISINELNKHKFNGKIKCVLTRDEVVSMYIEMKTEFEKKCAAKILQVIDISTNFLYSSFFDMDVKISNPKINQVDKVVEKLFISNKKNSSFNDYLYKSKFGRLRS